MTSPMTATSDNNNSAGVGFEVKLPRPCRRTTSKTSILEGTDRRESSTLVSHELASRVGPETDEGFVCLQQVHNHMVTSQYMYSSDYILNSNDY